MKLHAVSLNETVIKNDSIFYAVPVKEGIEKSGSHFYNDLLNYSRKIIKHFWSVFLKYSRIILRPLAFLKTENTILLQNAY